MRKFSDEEREQIREQLIETGRDLVLTFGPNKTTVSDITDPVGIAKPTFYQFFDAKSDLYIVILQQELEEYMENMRSELEGIEDSREALEQFFWCYVEFAEESEFIQQTFIKRDYQAILGSASTDQFVELEQKEVEAMVPHIEAIQERSDGPISKMEPITVLGLMGSSLGLLVLHKDEFEEYEEKLDALDDGYYKQIQDTLISVLARGLLIEN